MAHRKARGWRVVLVSLLQKDDLVHLNSVWCFVGNGGIDPYSSPYIIPSNSLHNPFPHSLLSTRQSKLSPSEELRLPFPLRPRRLQVYVLAQRPGKAE